MAQDRRKMLQEESIGRLLFKLSLPASFGMVVQALYNIVDAIFIGRGVGAIGIAGIAIDFPIQLLIMSLAQMVGIGAASLISRSLGRKDIETAEKTMGNLFALSIIMGISATIFGSMFLNTILKFFGATKEILPYSSSYMKIIFYGSTFMMFGMSSNNIVRAEGNANVAMGTMFVGAGINIVLDPIFIFGFHMGMAGAALATILSQMATFIWLTAYFLSKKSLMRFHLKYMKFYKSIVKEIFSIGSSVFVRMSSGSVLAGILNHLLAFYGGNMAITIFSLINRLTSFFLMLVFGIGQGFQPIAGFSYGAKRYDRTRESIHLAIIAATVVTATGFVLLELFPYQLISMFTKDVSLIKATIRPLRIISISFPFVGFVVIVSTLFQAIGKALPAFVLSISRQIIFLIPLVLTMPILLKLNGIWISFPIADSLTIALSTFMFVREMKKLNYKAKEILQNT